MTGGGLLDRIVENERVPEARIAFFMRQLLQALEHMHSKNIVHLDLKVLFTVFLYFYKKYQFWVFSLKILCYPKMAAIK